MTKNKHVFNTNSGFTLAELAVVIVLLALVTLLAATVTLLINRAQQISKVDAHSEAEIILLENALDGWLGEFDYSSATVQVDNNNLTITENGPKTYTFAFENGSLNYTGADGQAKQLNFESITGITLSTHYGDGQPHGGIVKCTIQIGETYSHVTLYTLRAATLETPASGNTD